MPTITWTEADAMQRVGELEAENERLREALDHAGGLLVCQNGQVAAI